MALNKNDGILRVTTKVVFPLQTYSTGTATTTAADPTIVVFGGGGVTTSMVAGGWIYDAAQTEVQKIVQVIDSTKVQIQYAFTTPLAAVAYTYSPPSRYKEVAWKVDASGAATIDGVAVSAASSGNWGKQSSGMASTSGPDFIDAVIVDGTVTPVTITWLK